MTTVWIGFFLAIALLMVIARKSIWIALLVAAFVLGIFTLPPFQIAIEAVNTLKDPSILLLALAVGMISIIGGALEISDLMDDLVSNLRMKKKNLLAFSPALFGMLPMPGGALLSAPIVEKGGEHVTSHKKSALNVWFRHVMLLIYPLGALLATTKIADINLYVAILYLTPGFILVVALGYIFLLRDIRGENTYLHRFNAKRLAIPLSVILAAPLVDLVLMITFNHIIPEIHLVIAVSMSLFLAFYFGRLGLKDIKPISLKMKPWNFALIIIAMFIFLNVFIASGAPSLIAELSVSKAVLTVCIGSLLGFATGRVQVPVAILVPVYFSRYGISALTPSTFAIIYFSTFIGYVISPVHPCVSVSLEYFKSGLKDFLKVLTLPTIISLIIAFICASLLL